MSNTKHTPTPTADASLDALMDELREEQGAHLGDADQPSEMVIALSEKLSKEEFMQALADTCDVEHDGSGYTPSKQVQGYLGKC